LPIATVTTRFSRATLSLILGTVAIVLCSFGLFQNFIGWLVLIGVAMGPIAACTIVTFFMDRSRLDWGTTAPAFRCGPLVAWAVGSLVGLATTPKSGFGFELFTLTTVPLIDAVLVAGVLIALLTRRTF
jgi:purine-cytosine permease-like protein